MAWWLSSSSGWPYMIALRAYVILGCHLRLINDQHSAMIATIICWLTPYTSLLPQIITTIPKLSPIMIDNISSTNPRTTCGPEKGQILIFSGIRSSSTYWFTRAKKSSVQIQTVCSGPDLLQFWRPTWPPIRRTPHSNVISATSRRKRRTSLRGMFCWCWYCVCGVRISMSSAVIFVLRISCCVISLADVVTILCPRVDPGPR